MGLAVTYAVNRTTSEIFSVGKFLNIILSYVNEKNDQKTQYAIQSMKMRLTSLMNVFRFKKSWFLYLYLFNFNYK